MIAQTQKHIYITNETEIISYSKKLRPYANSISATILMQKLEKHFEVKPNGFFKFLTAKSKTSMHKNAVSWEEELACTKEEFVSIFAHIGMRHTTKVKYQNASHPFYNRKNEEKYYCSYYDGGTGLTWYYRNHFLIDALGEKLLAYRG